MSDFLSMVITMITKCLKEHGFFKTALAVALIVASFSLCVLSWRLPDIITAIRWW